MQSSLYASLKLKLLCHANLQLCTLKMLNGQLSCHKLPVDTTPFEAFYNGSWYDTDQVKIKDGFISVQFNYNGSLTEERIQGDEIRLRSRKAKACDCSYLLKPGIDVCVRSAHLDASTSNQVQRKPSLSWRDAKIISIKRTPHEKQCTCLFSVIIYQTKPQTVAGKRQLEVFTVDNIAILQKLDSEPCEDGYYQWSSSEDCRSSTRSKLLSKIFSSEISWLVVLSSLKGMTFDIKVLDNKIVYHVVNRDPELSSIANVQSDGGSRKASSISGKNITIMRFQLKDEVLRPRLEVISVVQKESFSSNRMEEVDPVSSMVDSDSDLEILYDHKTLRHSKRRKMEPDRFTSQYPERHPHHSVRNKAQNINRCERSDPRNCNASRTSLLNEAESYQDMLENTIGRDTHKAELSNSTSEVHQRKNIPEETNQEDSIRQHQESITQTGVKRNGSWGKVERGEKSSSSHNIYHRAPQLERKKLSQIKKLLSAAECKKLFEICRGIIKSEMEREPQLIPQWPEDQQTNVPERLIFDWSSSSESEDEDEHADLWKEMEHSLTELALLEKKQESNFSWTDNISNKNEEQPCEHDYKLDEQIGQVCQKCNFICEIRYVLPPFLQSDGWATYRERFREKEKGWVGPNCFDSNPFAEVSSLEKTHSGDYRNAWDLIPDLKSKLHMHQKKAFEFIWKNITGSLKPKEMNHSSKDAGGCVISHSPGSGKTLLVISFLISYLKSFPKIRPLILCPKTAICVWCEELGKWKFPFPVHQIHPVERYKKKIWDGKTGMPPKTGQKLNRKMRHVKDCYEKLQQWHEHPSILLMSYPSFFTLAREDKKYEYKRFMADVLRRSPGLLILDEGHNPRSTRSKLRKLLMKVSTTSRILLSGTLFQNNFQEYFNTLSLARPRLIDDTISKLDPAMVSQRKKKLKNSVAWKEKLARKLFVENVGEKIESSNEIDRKEGFDVLKRITSGFVDSYEGNTAHTLPGLQIYTLLVRSTDLQQEILVKLQQSIKQKRCPLELDCLITVGSIHPWLIKTVECASEFLDADVLELVEKCKANFGSGSKAKFVIDLVHKCAFKGERVLIFCHNISPINFLVDLFESIFGWVLGEEVLVLKGDQDLSVRAKVMDAFNVDDKGKCKVLLASTNACSEGINLVAASRVVLLDSEWNHAKTTQAIARAFRPGQQRIVYVYRLLASGTYEEEKDNSNSWKSWLSRIIFIGKYFNYSPPKQADYIDDEILRELVEQEANMFQRIMTYDSALNGYTKEK